MISSEELKVVLIKELNLEDISPEEIDDNIALFGEDGLGLDSVDSIELVLILEKKFNVKVDDSKQYENIFSSISNLLKYINENKK